MRLDAFLQRIQVVAAFEHGREPAADMAHSIRIAENGSSTCQTTAKDWNIEPGIDILSGKSLSH